MIVSTGVAARPSAISDSTQSYHVSARASMIQQEDYTVRLEHFQGPLDLLLYLIRRNEVDVGTMPLAAIIEQYLGFLKQIDRIDVELAADFLVMAATLIEIKSRMLMPPDAHESGDAAAANAQTIDDTLASLADIEKADPRFALVTQLLAYKKFRDAAQTLSERRDEWADRFPLSAAKLPSEAARTDGEDPAGAAPEPPAPLDLEDLGAWDLFAAFQRIIEAVDFGRLGDHKVRFDDTPIGLHQTDLLDQLQRTPDHQLSLRGIFTGRTRGEMVGMFIAILELIRQRRITARQERIQDDVLIGLVTDASEPMPAAPRESPAQE